MQYSSQIDYAIAKAIGCVVLPRRDRERMTAALQVIQDKRTACSATYWIGSVYPTDRGLGYGIRFVFDDCGVITNQKVIWEK